MLVRTVRSTTRCGRSVQVLRRLAVIVVLVGLGVGLGLPLLRAASRCPGRGAWCGAARHAVRKTDTWEVAGVGERCARSHGFRSGDGPGDGVSGVAEGGRVRVHAPTARRVHQARAAASAQRAVARARTCLRPDRSEQSGPQLSSRRSCARRTGAGGRASGRSRSGSRRRIRGARATRGSCRSTSTRSTSTTRRRGSIATRAR